MANVASKGLEHHRGLRVHLFGAAEQERAKVRAVLIKMTDPVLEIAEIAPSAVSEGMPDADLAMVLFNNEEAGPLGYLQAKAARSPRPVMIALLHERSAALMRRALHAGADELMFLPLEESEMSRVLVKLNERQRRDERKGGGHIYSFTSLAGGVGVTTLCANLTLALNYALGKSAAVVDLDLQKGGLSLALQLEPEQTIAALPDFARALDSLRLEGALTKHPSGIYLLAAPKRIEDADRILDKTVSAVLKLMQQLFDFVVVDCGQRLDENAIAAWEISDEVIYVIDQSLAAAHTVQRFEDLFERLGLPDLAQHYLLNKADPQSVISESRLEEVVGESFYATIPRDDKLMERVQLRKQNVWQAGASSAYVRAMETLAWRLTVQREDVAASSGGLLGRLFGAFGARAST
ncbi:MAG TPA: AAA family ATPase [Candidatus Binataceae bacterium]|nr:AAA family ATPase [Candidatus Binataceae bacterium]